MFTHDDRHQPIPRCGSTRLVFLEPDQETPLTCLHKNFHVDAAMARITEAPGDDTANAFNIDVRVNCADCGEPFRWIGLPCGYSPAQPMVSVNGLELRAPMAPQSAPDGFGQGGPGFRVDVLVPDPA
ncbi:hypothetical protein [Dactylosporangium sp. CS-033363]|uniref:hypothetical protein n=1 Tax=Dactylosporangium sp. CS-033363 TaxID=3239935 RepID=UPI003D941494